MADKKISQLTATTQPTSTDVLPIVQSNETKKIPFGNLRSAIIDNAVSDLAMAFNASTNGLTLNGQNEDLETITTATETLPFANYAKATDLAQTDRRLDILYAINEGKTYQWETDTNIKYKKDVPSGSKGCIVQEVGGRSVVFNQLIDKDNYVSASGLVQSGITWTVDSSGFITANGTATADTTFYLNNNIERISGHKYLVDGMPSGSSNTTYYWQQADSSWTQGKEIYDIGLIYTSSQDDTMAQNRILIKSGQTVSNLVFKPKTFDLTLMFGSGTEPSTVAEFRALYPNDYYAYNAGEVKHGAVDKIVKKGANLIPYPYADESPYTINGVTYTVGEDGSITCNGTATASSRYYLTRMGKEICQKSITYTISTGATASANYYIAVAFYKGSTYTGTVQYTGGVNAKTFTVSDELDYDRVTIYILVANETTISNLIIKPMLVKASSAQTYAQYTKTEITIPSAVTALTGYGWGINDSIYNYVDWVNKKFHKKVGVVDMGTLTWTYDSSNVQFYTAGIASLIEIRTTARTTPLICSLYTTLSNGETVSSTMDRVVFGGTDGKIFVKNLSYTDATTFKTAMSGVMLYYELATEVETAITAELENQLVEGYGSLEFHQTTTSNGICIKVPSSEKYCVQLADA